MTTTRLEVSRRRLIIGGGAATGAAVLAGCAPDYPDAIGPADILAIRVDRVPIDDPDSGTWKYAPEKIVEMGAQQIALPNRADPVVDTITVRAVHDSETIGFLIEWDDPDTDDLTIRVDDFRDACAVLLAPGPGDDEMRTMGTPDTPATLLHWKADWQRDLDSGRSELDAAYPNRAVDVYPPFVDIAPDDVAIGDYEDRGVTEWIPGTHVDNPLSSATRSTPVEKLISGGFGTSTTASTQDARGRGTHHDAGWRVTLAKPLGSSDDGETALQPGGVATCAFAIWSGGDDDAGSRKTPSATVYQLVLQSDWLPGPLSAGGT